MRFSSFFSKTKIERYSKAENNSMYTRHNILHAATNSSVSVALCNVKQEERKNLEGCRDNFSTHCMPV